MTPQGHLEVNATGSSSPFPENRPPGTRASHEHLRPVHLPRPAPGGVVVGVDGSSSSLRALRWSVDQAVSEHTGR
jgi:hypothetical protein